MTPETSREAEFLDTYAMSVTKDQPIARRSQRFCRINLSDLARENKVASLDYEDLQRSLPDPLRCRFFTRIFFCAKEIPSQSSQYQQCSSRPRSWESGRERSCDGYDLNGGRGTDIKLGPSR